MNKWKILKIDDVSPDKKWFPVSKLKVEMPNGIIIDDFYISKLGAASMILALTPEKKLVTIKEYNPAIDEIIIGFPGGLKEENQTFEECAKAELIQETGYSADKFVRIGRFFPLAKKINFEVHAFLALDAKKISDQNLDSHEEIEIAEYTFDEVEELIKSRQIVESEYIAAFFLAKDYLHLN